MTDLRIECFRYEPAFMPFLRMLAHFDALDVDDDPTPAFKIHRYELLHPEDHFTLPDFAAEFSARLFWEFIHGAPLDDAPTDG